MNEDYGLKLQQEIDFLFGEMAYLQTEIKNVRDCADADEYTRLMRVFLPVQKQYLKLCAEQEKRDEADETDPLTAFNAAV